MLKGLHYEINKKNLLAHELIGLPVRVLESVDKNKEKVKGIVVDESKNVLLVENANGVVKKVPKKEVVFGFDLNGENVLVDGKKICFRPQDRVKVFWRNN